MPFFRSPYCNENQKPEWILDGTTLILVCIEKTEQDHKMDAIDRTFFWGIYVILFGMFFLWFYRKCRGTGRRLIIRPHYDSAV
jgi:hypothetical protein